MNNSSDTGEVLARSLERAVGDAVVKAPYGIGSALKDLEALSSRLGVLHDQFAVVVEILDGSVHKPYKKDGSSPSSEISGGATTNGHIGALQAQINLLTYYEHNLQRSLDRLGAIITS